MSDELSSFLNNHLRGARTHTHTCFANGKSPRPLHIPSSDIPKLCQLVVKYAKNKTQDQLSTGALSLTEKVSRSPDEAFRFFADIDFKTSAIAAFAEACSENNDTFHETLIASLRDMVQLYQDVVSKALGKDDDDKVDVVVATRLPYKIHLHFPGTIVRKSDALALFHAFENEFKDNPLYSPDVLDKSVYSTGLRILWSHKGAMDGNKMDRVQKERREHEELFGAGSWSGIYELTDHVTWEKKLERTVADLEMTSIFAKAGASVSNLTLGKGVAQPKLRRQKISSRSSETEEPAPGPSGSSESDSVVVSEDLKDSIRKAFNIHGDIDTVSRLGDSVIMPVKSKTCPYAKREHSGNHIYLVLSKTGVELRCHNATCKKKKAKSVPMERLSGTSRTEAETLMGIGLDADGLEQIRTSVRDAATRWPGLDTSELGVPVRSGLDSSPGYLTQLTHNRYCPICQREHDAASNCILTTEAWQRLICQRTFLTDQYPTPREHTTIFAAINNLNVNVTLKTGDDNTLRDFGRYDEFPTIHEDTVLNALCFESLSGRTRAVARYMLKLMTGRYAFQGEEWYWFEGKVWQKGVPPDDLMDTDMTQTYYQVLDHYTNDKQQGWLRSLIGEMGSLAKRKIYIEDLERECRKQRHELPFDANIHLIGFENGIFDSKDGSFRPHLAEDYLTRLLPYDLPTEVDTTVRADIENLIFDIMPDEDVRKFLLLTLALNLEGLNRHNIAMVWTGSGGNGKGVLKMLMQRAFCNLHHEPPATFLTSERPSADKPSADLFSLEFARSVFCSEPENGKKANSGFVKSISGNDIINARNVHEKNIRAYRPRFLVTLLCNAIPLFQGAETEVRGLWRRLKIIKFEMEFVEEPKHSYERKLDNQLEERTEHWGPQFMLFLIEKYKDYLASGRHFTVPRKVECNLDEQKEENDPFPNWFRQNLQVTSGHKLHVHCVMERFNESQSAETRYSTRALTTKLRNMRIPFGTVQGKAGCDCGKNNTYLEGYDFVQNE